MQSRRMGRLGCILVIVIGAGLALFAFLAPMQHRLDGANYTIPHDHDFTFETCGVMAWFGCPADEPRDSLWLIFPAGEVANDMPGFHAVTRGYIPDVQIDLTVHVSGGTRAQDFPSDYKRLWDDVSKAQKTGAPSRPDPTTGWTRIIWSQGTKGTPGEGFSSFYLVPPGGREALSPDWSPPDCLASPDQRGAEYFDCNYWVRYRGLIFEFSLPEENLGLAPRIAPYVTKRLAAWRND